MIYFFAEFQCSISKWDWLKLRKDARLHLAPGTMPSTPWSMATERTPPNSLGCAQLFDVEIQGTSFKDPTSRKPQKKTEIPRLCRSEISPDLDPSDFQGYKALGSSNINGKIIA